MWNKDLKQEIWRGIMQTERRIAKCAVLAALARTDGTVAKAAELLGVSRPTLYDLMHRLGLKT